MSYQGGDITIINRLIRIAFLFLMVGTSLLILAPFLIMIIWGLIIAVALYPLFGKMANKLGGRKSLAALILTVIFLAVIAIPAVLLTEESAAGYQNIVEAYRAGSLTIPAPTEDVKSWPLIGEKLYIGWDLAAHNLREFINEYSEQLRSVGSWLLNTLTSLGITILQFMASVIIAGIMLNNAEGGKKFLSSFATRLVNEQGEEFIKLSAGTIRSVVQGVLGIAFIQAVATAILMIFYSIPFPGLWAVLVLIIAIVQLPPLIVMGPLMIYVFSAYDTVPAVIFAVFGILISISDSLLKPIFLGRGLDIPMLIVLLGAIGGMIAFGLLGLFVGAVVLALTYKLLIVWMESVD